MQKYKNRKEVPEKYKWDLTDFFKDEKDFEDNYNKCTKLVDDLKSYRGCTKDSNKLLEFLEKDIEASILLENLSAYAYLISDQELGVSKSIERSGKCSNLENELCINESFFEPELLSLDKKEYDGLFTNKELLSYKNYLDKIYRNKEHVLDEKSEQIIANLENAMCHFEEMSSTMLNSEHDYGTVIIDGEEEIIAPTNLRRLLKNEDPKIRKEVHDKLYKVTDRYGVSSAQFLNGFAKENNVTSKIRKYKNAWDEKLFHLNMPNEAYEALVNTVEDNVKSLQKYFRVYKETLGLKELHCYDLSLDMAKSNKEYTIEEAQDLCLSAVKPLGEDYQKRFRKIIDNRYVDYAQYPGKCSGGYSLSTIDNDSRILMSYNFDLDSVSTLIHEGGHNVHHQYVKDNNEPIYRGISSLVAEVASLTNECLLSSYLANNGSSKEEKLSGISNILGVIVSNLFGAVREGKIEQDFYNYLDKGETLTKDYMNDLTKKSFDKYYGKEVITDDYFNLTWARRSHYYMNYYLYNYAFCISVACNVAKEILSGNEKMLENYKKFLSTGSDVWPIDAFKVLGVDLTNKKTYENAIKYFDNMLDEFVKISKEGE